MDSKTRGNIRQALSKVINSIEVKRTRSAENYLVLSMVVYYLNKAIKEIDKIPVVRVPGKGQVRVYEVLSQNWWENSTAQVQSRAGYKSAASMLAVLKRLENRGLVKKKVSRGPRARIKFYWIKK